MTKSTTMLNRGVIVSILKATRGGLTPTLRILLIVKRHWKVVDYALHENGDVTQSRTFTQPFAR